MPKICNECWFFDDNRCYLYSCGVPNRYNYSGKTKPDWCELCEIPPHGELIDRDALKQRARRGTDEHGRSCMLIKLGYVNTIPTIIPADRECSNE